MRKNKGMTLVELLGVIVVLAVIAIIAVPVLINVMEKAKQSAFRDSILNGYNAVDYKLLDQKLSEMPSAGISVTDLKLKGNLKSGKYLKEEDGTIIAYYITNGEYCAYGDVKNPIIAKTCEELDITAPVIDENKFLLTSTSNSITVNLIDGVGTDTDNGISKYIISLYKNDVKEKTKDLDEVGKYTFSGLIEGTTYKVLLVVVNNNNMESPETVKTIVTSSIGIPTYTVAPAGYTSGDKTVTINYPSGYTNEYSIDGGETFVEYTGPVTFTSNGTVIGRVSDGTNYVAGSSQTVSGIDKIGPKCGTYSGESTSWTYPSRTINVACTDEGGSGCEKATYSQTFSTSMKTGTFSQVIKDKAGNETTCTKGVNVYVDTTEPQVDLSLLATSMTDKNYNLPSNNITNTLSGINTVCKIGNTVYTNTNSLRAGTYTVICTATTGAGKAVTGSKSITVHAYSTYTLSSTGYDLYVHRVPTTVTRAQFPTWTEYGGQDDLNGDWSTSSKNAGVHQGNGTWYYRVKVSDHNNEGGKYTTHIYLYNADGTKYSAPSATGYILTVPAHGYLGSFYGGGNYDGTLASATWIIGDTSIYNNFTFEFDAKPTGTVSLYSAGTYVPYYQAGLSLPYIIAEPCIITESIAGIGLALGTNGAMAVAHSEGYYYSVLYYSADLSAQHRYKFVVASNIAYLFVDGTIVAWGTPLPAPRSVAAHISTILSGTYGKYKGYANNFVFYSTAR